MTTEANTVADELLAVVGTLRRQVRRAAGGPWPDTRLTGAQTELLRVVRTRPEISVAEAAQELGVAANTVSTLVGRLCADGLLRRRRSDADRRIAQLSLTPAAWRRVEAWRDRRSTLVAKAVDQLSTAELRSLQAALPAMRRLTEELRA